MSKIIKQTLPPRKRKQKRYRVVSSRYATEMYKTKFWAYVGYYMGRMLFAGPSYIEDTQPDEEFDGPQV